MEYVYWAVGVWCSCGAAVWLYCSAVTGFDKNTISDLFKFSAAGPLMILALPAMNKTIWEVRKLKKAIECGDIGKASGLFKSVKESVDE